MSDGVFLLPRIVNTADQTTCKQFARTTAFGTSGVSVLTKAGRVYMIAWVNSGASRHFAQIHDKATAAVNTDVPIWEESLPASGGLVMDFGLNGLYFANGLSIAISSTKGVLTLAAATDACAYGLYAVKT